jgi:ABC-type transport system substrate-binding protein
MGTVCKQRLLAVTFVALFVFMAVSPVLPVDSMDVPSDLNVGPYVDKVVYEVIQGQDQRILSLLNREVDFIGDFVNPSFVSILEAAEHISIANTLRNGYGHITINCDKYPLNITAFRRAFAYAFDKTRVRAEILDGFSQEHDSVVPYSNSWCIEDDLPYHYYTGQVTTGAAILDAAGFTFDPDYGYRSTPDGSHLNITIAYPSESPNVARRVAQIGVDALTNLDIEASVQPVNFDILMTWIDNNEAYDMAFYAFDFPSDDVDWLAYIFWGELADIPNYNPCNFRNTTYDSWRNQLLHSIDYEEIYEAAAAMQMILHENVPLVVAYVNFSIWAYNNEIFTGHILDLGRGMPGTWTLRNIQRNDGYPGGTVRIAIDEPETFNIYLASNIFESSINTELWPRLYLAGPDLQPWPYLAEHLLIETHQDNPNVPEDHTRFTVDIVQNATWSDGTPLIAEDVVFTFKYAFESGVHGNPVGLGLTDLVNVYAPTSYRVVFEFRTESYWHFSDFAYNYIIPKHIFNNVDGIGYEGWNTWNPVFNSTHPFVTAGPFELTWSEIGEFYEITSNPDFWYYPQERVTALAAPLFNAALVLSVGGVGAAVVTLNILIRRKSS